LKVGIEDVNAASAINMYPNPASSLVNITNAANANIYVYTTTGKLVYTQKSADKLAQLNLNTLVNGSYIVKIVKDAQVITRKLNVIK